MTVDRKSNIMIMIDAIRDATLAELANRLESEDIEYGLKLLEKIEKIELLKSKMEQLNIS